MAHCSPMVKQSDKSEKRPHAVIIHGLSHARVACLVAGECHVAIELHSAPNAAASLGPHWFQKILEEIETEFPDLQVSAILDCGSSAGFAMAALRQGIRHIRFSGRGQTLEKIRDMAHQQKAIVHTRWPKALDLGHEADPDTACRNRFAK